MIEIFLMLLSPFPPPTPEITNLVKLLAHENFQIREHAHIKLESLNQKAISAAYIGLKSNDLETKKRCQELLDSYFNLQSFEPIFKLDPHIALLFYKNQFQLQNNSTDFYYDEEVAIKATNAYIQTLLHLGFNKEKLRKLIESLPKKQNSLPEFDTNPISLYNIPTKRIIKWQNIMSAAEISNVSSTTQKKIPQMPLSKPLPNLNLKTSASLLKLANMVSIPQQMMTCSSPQPTF